MTTRDIKDKIRDVLHPFDGKKITIIDEGELHFNKIETTVPEEVWAIKEYRNRIKKVKTLEELDDILWDWYNKVKDSAHA
jgi:hypothetical protein